MGAVLRCRTCGGNLGRDTDTGDITCLQCGRPALPPPRALPLIRKLDAAAAVEIRARYAEALARGDTRGLLDELADRYDKSKAAIRHVIKGRTLPDACA